MPRDSNVLYKNIKCGINRITVFVVDISVKDAFIASVSCFDLRHVRKASVWEPSVNIISINSHYVRRKYMPSTLKFWLLLKK